LRLNDCRTGYENHIEELEQRLQTDQSADLVRDYESLKLKLATAELRYAVCTSGVLCVPQVCCVYLRCVPQVCCVYLRCAVCTSGVLCVPQVCWSGVYLRYAVCSSGVLCAFLVWYFLTSSLQEMEQLLNDKAFESQGQLQSANQEIEKLKEQLADRERQLITSPTQGESV